MQWPVRYDGEYCCAGNGDSWLQYDGHRDFANDGVSVDWHADWDIEPSRGFG
jgi:hypothetical protein